MRDYKTAEINITGIVQGVGFRPFLYNLARSLNLNGYILNRGNAGVRLVLQGASKILSKFLEDIERKKPEISYIENIEVNYFEDSHKFETLEIQKSEQGRGISLTLPPDISICANCLKDMRNPQQKKYYNYPFIACAVCGPRFTTVTELPYDRERSTMIEFPFCKQAVPLSCIQEYSDFNNRRFHAQTFACSVCGPHYTLYNKQREILKDDSIENILRETVKKIEEGNIVAIKGIGGVHLVCLANDDDIILKLRRRKGERKNKPFALMVPNLEIVESALKVSNKERKILNSFRKPIILLDRTNLFDNFLISKYVSPGLHNVGVMLPYSGIHHLLFNYIGEKPLIYTSGNKSYIPMSLENSKIFDQLEDLADVFLLHNRTIHQRVDDSVLRIHDEKIKLIRRSRGYVPEYIPLPFEVDVPGAIATGPLLTATGAILRQNKIFPTQHIGNISHLETFEFLKESIFHLKSLLQIKDSEILFVACDAHPEFITTKFARELGEQYKCKIYKIQHHYAHILSLMAENNVEKGEKIIGIATDGVGYGEDGNIWGGEILLSSYNDYQRLGQLEYQPMIGGDRCTKYPARMAASIFLNSLGTEESDKIFKELKLENDLEYKNTELKTLISQFKQVKGQLPSQNIPLTSSTGRIFDTVSYLLGASKIKTYRGEPAMRLEGLARKGNPNNIELNIGFSKKNGLYIIDTSDLIFDIITLLEKSKIKKEDIAAKFQIEFGKTFAKIAIKIAVENNIKKIGLSGGVALNYSFSKAIKEKIKQSGYIFLEHNSIPPGDAGISSGQLVGGLFNHYKEHETD
ncbi:MAG: carbamoyltransferase HypF [Candidatus Thorarchaeota archaeon]